MSYNIFNNVISNTVSIDSNIRSIVRQETLDIVNKVNTALEIHSKLKVENFNEFDGVYTDVGRKAIHNNAFQNAQRNLYVLNKTDSVYYTICFVEGNGWNFVEFSTNPETLFTLSIDLSEFIETVSFITTETRYFGSSAYPKNLNISYI